MKKQIINLFFIFPFISLIFIQCEEEKLSQVSIEELPKFKHKETILHYNDLQYNPCNDIIFPSVIKAYKYFDSPLGKYYMYYAPHSNPGGICLVYADKLEGPWHEYHKNPLIRNNWEPYYTVSHVSSPHSIWNEKESKLFLYFHGDNAKTRLASSTDGINFCYEGVVVTNKQFNEISAASYARVFKYTIPEKDNKFIMMLMGNNNGTRRIYLAWSDDGRDWNTRKNPFINPPKAAGVNQICSPWYFPYNGKNYVIFHGRKVEHKSSSKIVSMYVVEVNNNFNSLNYLGKFYDPHQISNDNKRISDPCIIREKDQLFLFGTAGPRLNQYIFLATSSLKLNNKFSKIK